MEYRGPRPRPSETAATFRFDVQQLPGGPVTGYLSYTAPGISLRSSSFATIFNSGAAQGGALAGGYGRIR